MNGSIGRIVFAICVWAVMLLALPFIGKIVASEIFFEYDRYGIVVGFAIGILLSSRTAQFFMVSVPEVSALATINLLRNGALRPYEPGLHFKYPWEQVKEGNYITFRLVKQELTETYPAKDGPELKVKWFFQYRARPDLLGRYIAVSEEVINTGLTDVGSKFLSQEIGAKWKKAEDCKKHQDEIEDKLKENFEKKTAIDLEREGAHLGIPSIPSDKDKTLEWLYGINLIVVGIADMDYEEKYQRARSSKAVADKLKEIANNIKRGDITEKEALNAAMIINKDISKNVQENIQEIKGEGMQAVASFIMALAQGRKESKKEDKKIKGGE